MTSNSLTENEEHDIPSQILKTIFGFFLDPNMCGFWHICRFLWSQTLEWSIGRITCLYHSTRVDLYNY